MTRFSSLAHVASTGSTNHDLLEAGRAGEPEGLVLITDHQTAGRGRQGRTWVEEPGTSLLMSVLLRPDPVWAPLIPLAMGLAVVEAVEAAAKGAGPDAEASISGLGLKWPNDVLVEPSGAEAGSGTDRSLDPGAKKLAGILAEATTVDGGLVVVVGSGLNLRRSADLPPEVEARVISMADLIGPVDRDDLARAMLTCLENALVLLESARQVEVLEQYRRWCVSIGRELRLEIPGTVLSGTAVGIGGDGALLLDTGDEVVEVRAGEAHHI